MRVERLGERLGGFHPVTMKRAAVLALLLLCVISVSAADQPPGDNPGQTPPQEFPPIPLPPQLPPEWFLKFDFTARNLLPIPLPPIDFSRPSGYIPPRCAKLYVIKSTHVVDCWLQDFPQIAEAIGWDFDGRGVYRWAGWSDEQKGELREAFRLARLWRASGFGPWPGPAFVEPPVNHEAPFLTEDELRTVLDSTVARRIYMDQVGIALAAELDAWVPWSLRDYDHEMLMDLFVADFHQFVLDRNDGSPLDSNYHGHIVTGGVTPAHPATVYRFFHENGILAPSRRATIARLLEWSTDHMRHYYVLGLPHRPTYESFWGYTGFPPVIRIIEGTVVTLPDGTVDFPGARRSWTAGCTGTSRFLQSVLRVVNIPAREISIRETGGHALPFFPSEGLYLSHGDDPYSQSIVTGDFTGDELFITSDQWRRWFPPGDESGHNVGRRPVDLNIVRPSGYVVSHYCQDQRAGLSRADGSVFAYFGRLYSLEYLEAIGLYDRVAALAETSSDDYCTQWRAER